MSWVKFFQAPEKPRRKRQKRETAQRRTKKGKATKEHVEDTNGEPSESEGDVNTNTVRVNATENEQASLLSRFLAAIGELQMIGFVCLPPASRRNEILVKLALGGRTA